MKVTFSLLFVLMMLGTSMAAIKYASEGGVLKINDKRFYLDFYFKCCDIMRYKSGNNQFENLLI